MRADAFFAQGLQYQRQGQLQKALSSYCSALEADPKHYEAFLQSGILALQMKEFRAALDFLMAAINLRPEDVQAYEKAGDVLMNMTEYQAAMNFYEAVLRRDASNASVLTKRGNCLYYLNILDEALECYDKAISLNQNLAEPFNNRGAILIALRLPDEAMENFERAIELDPFYDKPHYNKGLINLLRGDFDIGWKLHEKRLDFANNKQYPFPRWDGRESLEGKSILLCHEQGLGDSLQFCRYAPMLAELGAKVTLMVPLALVEVLQTLDGVKNIISDDEEIFGFDFYCQIMSLPFVFQTNEASIPANIPYLHASPPKAEYWRQRLNQINIEKLRVGLVWAGGDRRGEAQATNLRRNIPVEYLLSLKMPGIEFFSLQKGSRAEAELHHLQEIGEATADIHDFTKDLNDFSDTAAMLENLDLIISVDTSTAHLAGALGKEVWVLNRFDGCWRWMLGRTDSPWYPHLTLFRQPRPGDWESVIASVRNLLAEKVSHHERRFVR